MRLLAVALLACAPLAAQNFADPVRIHAGEAPINVDIGHAAPFYADVDGDGLSDLLVGQFGEGKLRIYKNVGSAKEPKFDKFEYLRAGGEIAKVPTG